jgi:uncharacterized protein (DUF1501 family)
MRDWTRRGLLMGAGASLGLLGLPGSVRALSSGSDLKFIFVFNHGGWDPTRVLAAAFDNPNVDMEPSAQLGTFGDLVFVDHGDRPSVRSFFQKNYGRSTIVNGVMVRSIAHEICTQIALTGSTSGASPDWPAILAAGAEGDYALPHLVLAGPSFPAQYGYAVARSGDQGQLDELLTGEALARSPESLSGLPPISESVIDRYLARRAAAKLDVAAGAERRLMSDYHDSHDKMSRLKSVRYMMDFRSSGGLPDQARVAVDALSIGLSRCVSLSHPGQSFGWDTHEDNDANQSPLWEGLFDGLNELMTLLDVTPGQNTETLAEETMVVVLSEMGRTPQLNAARGKDHWPYTSVLMVGGGLVGGRTVGGFDQEYYGSLVDFSSGDLAASGEVLSSEVIGATLLAAAGIDSSEFISGVNPLTAVLK